MLLLLVAMPVSATLCGMLCDSAAQAAAAHHGSGKDCEQPVGPSDDLRMGGISAHDCSNHGSAVRQLATTPARGALAATSVPVAAPAAYAAFTPLPDFTSIFEYRSPPGAAPPTTIPLVLRV